MDDNQDDKATQEVLSQVVEGFQQRFGSEPGPDSQRFAEHQQQTLQQMIEAMKANGMDPAYVYAVEKTGIMVFQETMHLIAEADMTRWEEAYLEYERRLAN